MRIFEPILGDKASSLRESDVISYYILSEISGSLRRSYTDNPDSDANGWWTDEVRRQDGDLSRLQNASQAEQ